MHRCWTHFPFQLRTSARTATRPPRIGFPYMEPATGVRWQWRHWFPGPRPRSGDPARPWARVGSWRGLELSTLGGWIFPRTTCRVGATSPVGIRQDAGRSIGATVECAPKGEGRSSSLASSLAENAGRFPVAFRLPNRSWDRRIDLISPPATLCAPVPVGFV